MPLTYAKRPIPSCSGSLRPASLEGTIPMKVTVAVMGAVTVAIGVTTP